MAAMTDDLRARILEAVRQVRIKLGPIATEMALAGATIHLTQTEARGLTDAVMAVLDEAVPRLLHEYADLIDAVDPQCTALVGPVWYGQGWHEAAHHLHDLADAHPVRTRRTEARGLADATPRAVVEFPAGTRAEDCAKWQAAWRESGGGPVDFKVAGGEGE